MSSRSGSRSRRHRSREPNEDFPALPVSRLPSLRALTGQRVRDNTSPSSTARPSMPRSWSSATARRAERIRSLNEINSFPSRTFDLSRTLETSSAARPEHPRIPDTQTTNLDDLDRSLDEANSHLRHLLEMTGQSATMSYALTPQSNASSIQRPSELSDETRRNKRRKIDSDRLAPSAKPFRYGKYGQVEPGQLRMEIASCDGGMYSSGTTHAAENILLDDDSVYCTKGNRCNVVLRHQGDTPFTLTELIIKGPTSLNYSHPIREGMVFISMDQDDVLKRTAQYQIQYSNPQSSESLWGRRERDGDPPREGYPVVSIRHHNDGTTTTRIRRAHAYRTDEEDYRIAQMPPEFASNLPNVGVTLECSDEDDDEPDGRHFNYRAPNRIGSLPFENQESDEDNENIYAAADFDFDDFLANAGHPHYNVHHSQTTQVPMPSHNHPEPTTISFAEALEAHNNATQEAVRAVGGQLLQPHGRFYIEKRKSTCTMRFDPPVSGRCILLKMWNTHHDPTSNIDIQSIIACGFAGPRYFPSIELR